MLRWLGRNLSTLLLAFVLAVVVWVSAVMSADPNQEGILGRAVPIEVKGKDPDLIITGDVPSTVRVTLNAPQSIWTRLNTDSNLVTASIDLSGLGADTHTVPVKIQVSISPVQVVDKNPSEVTLALEQRVSRTFDVQLQVSGDPALGYRKGIPSIDPQQVTVSGPKSLVGQIVEVQASLDISRASETVQRTVSLEPLDANNNVVSSPNNDLTLNPSNVVVTQPISLQGGYRNVVVKVVTSGEVADGYWLTNISVSPPNVTVFSTNPQQVNELPGYVETNPIDLTGLNDDVDVRATLNLPEGVTLVGEESVLVRIGIASIEGSLRITLPLEVVGLPPDQAAEFSPESVDVLLSGPLPILNNLKPAAIRVSMDLTGLEVGAHQVTPVVDLLPNQVRVESIIPETIEVTIVEAPTPTATSSEAGAVSSSQPATLTPGAATPTITVTAQP
jgi:YbbR domain-containing protein